jgi:ABC-type dipeptide/oligopeptide/nickel transport system permease subunit
VRERHVREHVGRRDVEDLGGDLLELGFPGLFLTSTVLSINLLGDGLRDLLDPQLARRM